MKIKKLLAFALVLTMCLSLFPVFAAADEGTPTITAYDAANVSQGTYSTIDTAAAAAGENGKIVLSAGTFYFNGRQTIAVNGITLQGAGMDQTTVTTSSSYAGGSTTNRKALLTIAANNVTVSGISFDGGTYGSTLVPTNSEETQFNVIRVNSGSTTLSNVYITGSNRTLLSIGTSSTSASVTATGLYCDAAYKTITNNLSYADVLIVKGTLTLNSYSRVNGIICKDRQYASYGTFNNNCTANHYTFTFRPLFTTYTLTSTLAYFANTYAISTGYVDKLYYSSAINSNLTEVIRMVTEAVTNVQTTSSTEDITVATNLRAALNDAKTYASGDALDTLNAQIARLDAVLT